MKHTVRLCAIVMVCGIAGLAIFDHFHAAGITRTQGQSERQPKPSFVLVEYNPWAMVIGADSPTFALYDDGTVIYWKSVGRGGKYLSAKLTGQEVSELLKKINPQAIEVLNNHYEPAAGITDQPTYLMAAQRPDGSYKGVSIYGSLRSDGLFLRAKRVPQALIDAFQSVSAYDNSNARDWLPDFIEVMIWPYEYAPDENLAWPKEWPNLSDSKTVKRGDSYSLFIEKSHYGDLSTFLSKRREKQAVQIEGRKWAISIRFPFPNESVWIEVNRQINKELSRKP
jgi:hypothetical protein